MADQRDSDSASSPSEPPVVPLWPWCVAKIKRKLHERRAERENEDPQDRFARRTAGATVWIAILAVVAAVVGVLQYLTFKSQLAEMRDEQRPWVYADLGSGGIIYRNQAGGFTIPVAFTFHNTGHLPAMYVWPDVDEYLYGVGPDAALDARDRQKKKCDVPLPLRQSGDQLGTTVFPGQNVTVTVGAPIAKDDIEALKAIWLKNSGQQLTFFAPSMTGCIRYKAPNNSDHQTGVAFTILTRKPGQFDMALPIDPTTVDPATIRFEMMAEGGTAYAN